MKLLYYNAIHFCALMIVISFSAKSQVLMYTSTTDGVTTDQKISRETDGSFDIVEIWETEKYSGHYFTEKGATKKWIHQDKASGHEFVAVRNNNEIAITGFHQHDKINKTVSIDDDVWINKIDHGLSYFAQSDKEETTFWTLKIADLEPIQFKAYKEEVETIDVDGQPVESIEVKITLKNIFLANLWSARLWYRASDGLFLKYEGAQGRPGTPVTTIVIAEDI